MIDQNDIDPSQPTNDTTQISISKQKKEIEYPGDKKLFRIADLADAFSWAVLALSILSISISLINSLFVQLTPIRWAELPISTYFMMATGYLENLIYAVFAFLVLQAIGEIIYLLLDIRYLLHPEQYLDRPSD